MFNLGSIGSTLYHFVTPGTGNDHDTLNIRIAKDAQRKLQLLFTGRHCRVKKQNKEQMLR